MELHCYSRKSESFQNVRNHTVWHLSGVKQHDFSATSALSYLVYLDLTPPVDSEVSSGHASMVHLCVSSYSPTKALERCHHPQKCWRAAVDKNNLLLNIWHWLQTLQMSCKQFLCKDLLTSRRNMFKPAVSCKNYLLSLSGGHFCLHGIIAGLASPWLLYWKPVIVSPREGKGHRKETCF